MKRFPKIPILTIILMIVISINIFGDNVGEWKYATEITYDNEKEVKAVFLNEDVYRHAKSDLSDIRIVNKDNEFIPYYISNGFDSTSMAQYQEYTSDEVLSFMKEQNHYIDYKINQIGINEDIVGNKLILEVPKDNFYKEVEVLGSFDNKSWKHIKNDMIYNINGQNKPHVLLDGSYKYDYYRIISINDITGVPISRLTLVYDDTESIYEQYRDSKIASYEIDKNGEKNKTIVKIHNKDRLRINTIKIKSKDDFNRNYEIYKIDGEDNTPQLVKIGSIYRFNLDQFKAEDTNIQLDETTENFIASEYIQIVISDRDDQPINIEEIEMDYFKDKIVFKTKDPNEVYLWFGNEEALKPHYDISSYIVEMEKTDQEISALTNLIERDLGDTEPKSKLNTTLILNICVILISGFLVLVIIKKK